MVLNLIILCFFKYSPLIGDTFFLSTSDIGSFLISIPLPIGISFFTFQGISLMVDTFKDQNLRKKLQQQTFFSHTLNILLFKSFFPQLIAGPIVKAYDFLPQILYKRIQDVNFGFCIKKLILGYFLKW